MAYTRKAAPKRSFGQVAQMRSGRYQARYTGPDGARHAAPKTFEAKDDAVAWLRAERLLVESPETWLPPKVRLANTQARFTFGSYADAWLERRTLKPRSRVHYRQLLDAHLLPTFGEMLLPHITSESVHHWHSAMGPDRPTLRSHSYALLRTILNGAEEDELIPRNPCHIRGAGNTRRVHLIQPASLGELTKLVNAMPEQLQVMTLLAAWCGLRFGELAELRRKDVDLKAGQLRIRRAVVRVHGQTIVDTPKTNAGIRDVAIPPHLIGAVEDHLATHAQAGTDGLLFPGKDGNTSTRRPFMAERRLLARRDTTFTRPGPSPAAMTCAGTTCDTPGAVLAAATGATLAELMARLGHSTPAAAMRYQHAAEGRDLEIARKLSALAAGLGDASLGTV